MLRCGGTRILVGVKAELMSADPLFPNTGKVEVSCNTQSPLFNSFGDDESSEICSLMNRLLSDGVKETFLESLCVAPGKQCWNLYADASVLDYDGGLLDCVAMAVYAALADTSIPKIKILDGNEIELLDGPEDCTPMVVEDIPIFVTLWQIRKRFIIDATLVEECCSDTSLCVGINKAGKFCGSHKHTGRGLHPSQLGQMLQACQQLGQQRIQRLNTLIAQKQQQQHQDQLLDDQMLV
jgi:exosome complex component RRP42